MMWFVRLTAIWYAAGNVVRGLATYVAEAVR